MKTTRYSILWSTADKSFLMYRGMMLPASASTASVNHGIVVGYSSFGLDIRIKDCWVMNLSRRRLCEWGECDPSLSLLLFEIIPPTAFIKSAMLAIIWSVIIVEFGIGWWKLFSMGVVCTLRFRCGGWDLTAAALGWTLDANVSLSSRRASSTLAFIAAINGLVDSLIFAGVEIGERYSGKRIGVPRLSIRRCIIIWILINKKNMWVPKNIYDCKH